MKTKRSDNKSGMHISTYKNTSKPKHKKFIYSNFYNTIQTSNYSKTEKI